MPVIQITETTIHQSRAVRGALGAARGVRTLRADCSSSGNAAVADCGMSRRGVASGADFGGALGDASGADFGGAFGEASGADFGGALGDASGADFGGALGDASGADFGGAFGDASGADFGGAFGDASGAAIGGAFGDADVGTGDETASGRVPVCTLDGTTLDGVTLDGAIFAARTVRFHFGATAPMNGSTTTALTATVQIKCRVAAGWLIYLPSPLALSINPDNLIASITGGAPAS